jgi:predicted kinase
VEVIALFGGPAGAGKTTVAKLWCATRARAVHLELDSIRDLIVSGRADPQVKSVEQATQYVHSVEACCALAHAFTSSGYDVAVDDVFEPGPTANLWYPRLAEDDARIVILLPSLAATLERSGRRAKRVSPEIIHAQHTTTSLWPATAVVASQGLSSEATLQRAIAILNSSRLSSLLSQMAAA